MSTTATTMHSEGPWTFDTDEQGCKTITDRYGEEVATTPGWFDEDNVKDRANAMLIAAAPEMLSATKALLDLEWQCDDDDPRLQAARLAAFAAVAKAEGL